MTTTQPGRVEQWMAQRPWIGMERRDSTDFAREVDAEAAAQRALIAELAAALASAYIRWHSTHGWEDDRAIADSFADCIHVLCVEGRHALDTLTRETADV